MKAFLSAAALLAAAPAAAQDHAHDMPVPAEPQAADHSQHDMSDMKMDDMAGMDMGDVDVAATSRSNSGPGTGTSRLPGAEGGMRGIHLTSGDWMVMAHGFATLAYTDGGGPRGDDSALTSSMAMLSASRGFGAGANLQFNAMFSLDPLNGI